MFFDFIDQAQDIAISCAELMVCCIRCRSPTTVDRSGSNKNGEIGKMEVLGKGEKLGKWRNWENG